MSIADEVERIVVLAAHPDDESLGAGGVMRLAHRGGLRLELVLATAGEHSHPSSPTTNPESLALQRRAELERAAHHLGLRTATTYLGITDGQVEANQARLTTALVDLVEDGRRTLILAPWRHDGHPDHDAAGRAAAAAAVRTGSRLLEYPVWWWHHTDPAELSEAVWTQMRAIQLDDDARAAKRAAIAAHRSQVEPLSPAPGDEPLLSPTVLEHFTGDCELFIEHPPADPALDDLHADQEEPWDADSRWYEQRKRDLLLALLPRRRFGRALEIGCSTGVMAAFLAPRCDHLTAVDSSSAAVETARARLRGSASAEVIRLDLPSSWPPASPTGRVDLVVCSEVGYFLSPLALDQLAARVRDCLHPAGVVVLAHWRHRIEGWVLDGPEVHRRLVAGIGLAVQASYRDRDVEMLLLGPTGSLPEPSA